MNLLSSANLLNESLSVSANKWQCNRNCTSNLTKILLVSNLAIVGLPDACIVFVTLTN